MTTRTRMRAAASALVTAGIVLSAAGGVSAEPFPESSSIRPASSSIVTPGDGPVSISVIVPVVLPPSSTGLLSAEELERFTADTGSLSRQLDAIVGTPAVLAIDPMILASIRVLGSGAPESARAWLDRIESLPNESFLLAYNDGDVLTAVRTATFDVLTPSGFGFALDADRFAEPTSETPAPLETPQPTQTPDPDAAPPFPTTEQLLEWSSSLPVIGWPAGPGVGSSDATALAGVGFETLLLADTDTGEVGNAHAVVGDIDALVIDTARSQSLRTAASTVVDADRAVLLEALAADLAAQAAVAPGRTMLLSLDRTWPNSPVALREVLFAISAAGSAQLVPLGEVLASPRTTVALGDGTRDVDREAALTSLLESVAAELQFSTVLTDPAALLDPRRLEQVALYGVGWLGDASWSTAVEAFRERSEEIVTSVRIERGSDLVLLASNTGIRVSVSNALDLPITVRVAIDPRSPILRAEESVELTVEPNSTASAYVPVEAIANGDVRVATSLTSLAGVPIDSGVTNISVRAEWENLGTLALILVLVAVFAAGIIRLFLRRRRAAREDTGD